MNVKHCLDKQVCSSFIAPMNIVLMVLFFLVGCGELGAVKSTDLGTEGIYMDALVFADSSSTNAKITVRLTKKYSYGNNVELSGGEYLTAHYGGQSIKLDKQNIVLGFDYEGLINIDNLSGPINIIFHRSDGSNIESIVELPSYFTVSTPVENDIYIEDDIIYVRWLPIIEGGIMNFDGHLLCYAIEDNLSPDTDNEHETYTTTEMENYIFPTTSLASSMRLEILIENDTLISSKPCEFDINVYRKNETDLSTVFAENSSLVVKRNVFINNMKLYIHG